MACLSQCGGAVMGGKCTMCGHVYPSTSAPLGCVQDRWFPAPDPAASARPALTFEHGALIAIRSIANSGKSGKLPPDDAFDVIIGIVTSACKEMRNNEL